jgi:uncharacterized protein YjbI with pentapeptide repeats
MTSNTPWQPITKPIAVWNKQLNTDFKDFFLSLTKAAIDVAVTKWDDAASNAVDALEAVGLTHDAGQIAWLLIRRALARATFDLIQEHVSQLKANAPRNPNEFIKTLDDSLESVSMTIDTAFFERPQDLPVVAAFQIPFKQWLIEHGFEEAPAATLVARLPSYFVFALNHEWRRKPDAYQLVKEAIETPFTRAGEREQNWGYYYAWLQKQIHESVFNEAFGLNQIYIPLRAYYEREVQAKRDSEKKVERVVVNLQRILDDWVNQADPRDAIRLISGGPGAGKSSFTRMYAAHQTYNPHLRVLFILLHHFDPKGDLVASVGEFVRYATQLSHNPLDRDSGEKRLLILFDGLDELAMQGKIGADTARDFVDEVDRVVSRLNSRDLRLQVLLTGRDVVIQANANKFRKETQILHVLSYFLSEKDRKTDQYVNASAVAQTDQRQTWWQQYGAATGRNYGQMPAELMREDLDEITSQPLLNYLVALSYTRGELDFSLEVNLNQIYDDLLKAVYRRDYAGGQNRVVGDLSFEQFVRILEEIGLATWHGDGRTTTIKEVQKHCETAGLSKLLEQFRQSAEIGVARLFTAFYFRQHETYRDSEPTFEFTHKSFGEYLTARRLVRGLERIHDEMVRRQDSMESGWDERLALKYWAELYLDTPPITHELVRFASSEIALKDKEKVAAWQQRLCHLINWMLQYGMPMELLNPRPSYHKETLAAQRAEEALLAVLYACARVTERISHIARFQVIPTAVGAWWDRLQGERDGAEVVLTFQYLGFLDLSSCDLAFRNLKNFDLRYADLRGANLEGVNLERANLERANLERANLQAVNLQSANLQGANLDQTNLEGVNLERANLERANLARVNLRGVNLERANLEWANLEWANLVRANLQGTRLEEANLAGANLRQAKLQGAKLHGSNLERAKLERANLQAATLERANLRGVNLEEANLAGANLDGANLDGAVLPDRTTWRKKTDLKPFTEPKHP